MITPSSMNRIEALHKSKFGFSGHVLHGEYEYYIHGRFVNIPYYYYVIGEETSKRDIPEDNFQTPEKAYDALSYRMLDRCYF